LELGLHPPKEEPTEAGAGADAVKVKDCPLLYVPVQVVTGFGFGAVVQVS
jgi:hypothetical protein